MLMRLILDHCCCTAQAKLCDSKPSVGMRRLDESHARRLEAQPCQSARDNKGNPADPHRNCRCTDQNGPSRQGAQQLKEGNNGKNRGSKTRVEELPAKAYCIRSLLPTILASHAK